MIEITTRIVCDFCCTPFEHAVVDAKVRPNTALGLATDKGWIRRPLIRGGEDICPSCQELGTK